MLPGQHSARKENADHITNLRLQITHQHQDSLVCADIHQYPSIDINGFASTRQTIVRFYKASCKGQNRS